MIAFDANTKRAALLPYRPLFCTWLAGILSRIVEARRLAAERDVARFIASGADDRRT